MAEEVKITEVKHFPSHSPGRLGQRDTYVFYTSGSRTGYIVLPSDNPSEADIKAAIAKDLQLARTLKGKTLTVG